MNFLKTTCVDKNQSYFCDEFSPVLRAKVLERKIFPSKTIALHDEKGIMAIHKRTAFGREEQELAALAKALSHPARIAILKELSQHQSCVCGEIVEVLPLAQSTVSQHLKELLEAGLIKGTVDGAKSCYCINLDTVKRFEKILESFFTVTVKGACC